MVDGFPLPFFIPLVVHALAGMTTAVTGILTFPRHAQRAAKGDASGTETARSPQKTSSDVDGSVRSLSIQVERRVVFRLSPSEKEAER
jgi:hypothetical protein